MVQTQDNTLRIYTNDLGIFSVDGYPICINKHTTPAHSLDGVDQRFVQDMDNDGLSDIVTNQEGEIRIVYGGKSGNGYSYISRSQESCDNNRSSRQSSFAKQIDNLATQLIQTQTTDRSLLRRQ